VVSKRANDPVLLPPEFGKVVDAINARLPG